MLLNRKYQVILVFFGHFKLKLEKDCIPKEKVLGHQVILSLKEKIILRHYKNNKMKVILVFGHFKLKLEKDCVSELIIRGHFVFW